jgi:hypothetical protein
MVLNGVLVYFLGFSILRRKNQEEVRRVLKPSARPRRLPLVAVKRTLHCSSHPLHRYNCVFRPHFCLVLPYASHSIDSNIAVTTVTAHL